METIQILKIIVILIQGNVIFNIIKSKDEVWYNKTLLILLTLFFGILINMLIDCFKI